MQAPIDQALHLLLPTANLLPAQLVSTASALLAQSKNVAPTLKGEEEIARTYACCHIACQRLSQRLSLDIGKILPPCNPRVYKKLHAFLDGMLVVASLSQPSTPRAKRTVDALTSKTPTSAKSNLAQRSMPLQRTPSGHGTPKAQGDKTPPSAKGQRKQQTNKPGRADSIPPQLSQLNQHLCQSMGLSDAVPYVLAGLQNILPHLDIEEQAQEQPETPSKRKRKASKKVEPGQNKMSKINIISDQMLLIVVALCLAISRTARSVIADQDAAEELFSDTILFLRNIDDGLAERMSTDEAADILPRLQTLIEDISGLPFWEEWLASLTKFCAPQSTLDDGHDEEDLGTIHNRQSKTPFLRREKHRAHSQHDDAPGPSGLLPGLGTMFQPAVDWLSEDRRASYEVWKKGVLQEVAAMEAA